MRQDGWAWVSVEVNDVKEGKFQCFLGVLGG